MSNDWFCTNCGGKIAQGESCGCVRIPSPAMRPMTEYEKLVKMYTEVHGELSTSCHIEEWTQDEEDCDFTLENTLGLRLMKDDHTFSKLSKADILFDYITQDWETEDTNDTSR